MFRFMAGVLLFWLAVILILLYALFAPQPAAAASFCGSASWYGKESCLNPRDCRTASGERYTGKSMTAAHRSLPFGTKLKVTDQKTGKSVVVVINDRGPASWTGRVLDLSKAAGSALGIIASGHAKVCAKPA